MYLILKMFWFNIVKVRNLTMLNVSEMLRLKQ